MIFKGDLGKYHAADALMFVSHLNMNGVLSVAYADQMVSLSFNKGRVIDGNSAKGDEKLLSFLRFNRHIDAAQLNRIRRIKTETGIPVRQILGQLNLFPLAQIKDRLEDSIKEVLLELFLLDSGEFHFSDTVVAPDEAGICLDAGALTLAVTTRADEFRNFQKDGVAAW